MAFGDRSKVNRLKICKRVNIIFIKVYCTSSIKNTQGHFLPYAIMLLALLKEEKYNLERALRQQPPTSKIEAIKKKEY